MKSHVAANTDTRIGSSPTIKLHTNICAEYSYTLPSANQPTQHFKCLTRFCFSCAGNRLDDKTCERVSEELVTHQVEIQSVFDKTAYDMVEKLCPALTGCFPLDEAEHKNCKKLNLAGQ